VVSLLKDTKVEEKLLGDSPDRLAMGELSPLLIKKKKKSICKI
jgi:hypothetical protein